MDRLRARLKVSTGPKTYYCQASELSKATHPLSRWKRCGRMLTDSAPATQRPANGAEPWNMVVFKSSPDASRRARARKRQSAPIEGLNLRPGESVEVKSMQSIIETSNDTGYNRQLYFSPDVRLWYDQQCRVKGRLDKIIVDGTGKMRPLRQECLESSTCGCSYMGFGMGGCSRCELTYWREIWLRRSDAHNGPLTS